MEISAGVRDRSAKKKHNPCSRLEFLQMLLFNDPYFNISDILVLCWMVTSVVKNWGRPSPITETLCRASPRGPSASGCRDTAEDGVSKSNIYSMCEYSDSSSLLLLSIAIPLTAMNKLAWKQRIYSGHVLAQFKIFLTVIKLSIKHKRESCLEDMHSFSVHLNCATCHSKQVQAHVHVFR